MSFRMCELLQNHQSLQTNQLDASLESSSQTSFLFRASGDRERINSSQNHYRRRTRRLPNDNDISRQIVETFSV